jgi:hypothetical protein
MSSGTEWYRKATVFDNFGTGIPIWYTSWLGGRLLTHLVALDLNTNFLTTDRRKLKNCGLFWPARPRRRKLVVGPNSHEWRLSGATTLRPRVSGHSGHTLPLCRRNDFLFSSFYSMQLVHHGEATIKIIAYYSSYVMPFHYLSVVFFQTNLFILKLCSQTVP